MTPNCYFCGHSMNWQSDFNYDEVFGEGEGIVSYWHCCHCGADAEFSLREDEEE